MDIVVAALISFTSFWLIISHLQPRWMRRVVGYKGLFDLALHGSIIYLFFGTSTLGLMQAEAAGILFSFSIRAYRHMVGYERFNFRTWRWDRYTGRLNRGEALATT